MSFDGTSTGQPPIAKPTRLIVVWAFIRDAEGQLRPAFEPREMPSEAAAKRAARLLAVEDKYQGVIAWWRSADLVSGDFGDPIEIFKWGIVPEMEDWRSGAA